jgi:hypothetical protein
MALIATFADTLVTAGATLVGVIVGAALASYGNIRLERARQATAARAAARVLQLDVWRWEQELKRMSNTRRRTLHDYDDLRVMPSWESSRTALATALSKNDWQLVFLLVLEAELWAEDICRGANDARRKGSERGRPYSYLKFQHDSVEKLAKARQAIPTVGGILASLAGTDWPYQLRTPLAPGSVIPADESRDDETSATS